MFVILTPALHLYFTPTASSCALEGGALGLAKRQPCPGCLIALSERVVQNERTGENSAH